MGNACWFLQAEADILMCLPPTMPSLIAGETIEAYRIVCAYVGASPDFKLRKYPAANLSSSFGSPPSLGVTGSSSTSSGSAVTLQCGDYVTLTASNSIPAGGLVEPTTGGLALYLPPPYESGEPWRYKHFQALQSASPGQTFLAIKAGACLRLNKVTTPH